MPNHQAVVSTLKRSIEAVANAEPALGPTIRALTVHNWLPARGDHMTADVGAFRRAAMIVAPHGAGLANMLFASAGTPVIEICYDDFGNPNTRGMACPAMYAAMAVNLHLPYWVVTGAGGYGSHMNANISMLSAAATQALHVAYAGARHSGAHTHHTKTLPKIWKELPACGGLRR